MSQAERKPIRRLKLKYRKLGIKQKLEIARLWKRVAELERKYEGDWVSDNGVWCDIVYAARYIGRSEQRLRNMKSDGTGPMVYDRSGAVRYKLEDLERFMETGWGLNDAQDGNK